jgi:uncharacterized protein
MSIIFLDTSFIVALHAIQEQQHATARKTWAEVIGRRGQVTTTTFVLDEAVTFFNNRGHHALAVSIGRQILESPAFDLIHVDAQMLERGWDYFVRHKDKRYSLTDCISFVIMEQRGLSQALTLDHHFAQAGFECLPA